jgi:alkylation response protein AidB-like acyl-CoA dehydrogenase
VDGLTSNVKRETSNVKRKVESFSVVPRLYRDSVVFESWEGSHNVLCLQVMRDALKYRFHEDCSDFTG